MRREYDEEPLRQIVGIVGNVRDTGVTRAARPAMYVPMAQEPDGVTTLNVRLLPIVWMARTATPPMVAARYAWGQVGTKQRLPSLSASTRPSHKLARLSPETKRQAHCRWGR